MVAAVKRIVLVARTGLVVVALAGCFTLVPTVPVTAPDTVHQAKVSADARACAATPSYVACMLARGYAVTFAPGAAYVAGYAGEMHVEVMAPKSVSQRTVVGHLAHCERIAAQVAPSKWSQRMERVAESFVPGEGDPDTGLFTGHALERAQLVHVDCLRGMGYSVAPAQ